MTTLIKMEERDQYHDNLMVYRIEIEEAMARWNGEEYEPPWDRKEWNPDENFLTVIRSIKSDYIMDLVVDLSFRGLSLIESLVKKCNDDNPESTSVQLIREVCDIDFAISALIEKYPEEGPLDRWFPFLGKSAFSIYSIQKLELLHENGNLPDSTIIGIVQSTDKNNDHWGKVIFSLVEKVLNRIKNKKSIGMGLSGALNRLDISALVTERIGDYYDKSLRKAKITQKGGKTSGSTKIPIGPSIKSITYKVLNKIQNGEELTDEEENVKKQLEKSKRKPPYKNYLSEYILKTFRPKYKDIVKKLESDKIISVQIALELVDCNEWFNEFVLRSIISNCKGRGKFAHRFRGATVEMKKRRDESLRDSAEIEESATDAPDDLVRHLVVLPKNN